MSEIAFRAGEVIFRPGDPSEQAYLVRSGQVEIVRGFPDQPARVALRGEGEVFGEMGLIDERPRSLAARAVTDGTANVLTKDEFFQQLLQDPQQCQHYLRSLFERIRSLAAQQDAKPAVPALPAVRTARVHLTPLTPQAGETLRQEGMTIDKFPFRLGRAPEARESEGFDLNDHWVLDRPPFTVSRNHAALDRQEGDRYVVIDRGSFLGTVVNGQAIGGKQPVRSAGLRDGDNVVILGPAKSPFQFKVTLER